MHFNRRNFTDTPVVGISAPYAAGKQIGTAPRQIGFTNPGPLGVGTAPIKVLTDDMGLGLLEQVVVSEIGTQKSAIDLFLFNALPVLTSAVDGATFAMSAAEWLKCIGVVNVAQADYKGLTAAQSMARVALSYPGLALQGAVKSKDLWYMPVSQGTPTYVTVHDLAITFCFKLP